MIDYKKLFESIKKSEGGIITLMIDTKPINSRFINDIKTYLESDYKIENDQSLNVEDVKEKTIAFFNFDEKINFTLMMGNLNVIMIIIREESKTHNIDLFGSVSYSANIIFYLKNEKLKILKSRYLELYNDSELECSTDINMLLRDIAVKIRPNKLNELNEINKNNEKI